MSINNTSGGTRPHSLKLQIQKQMTPSRGDRIEAAKALALALAVRPPRIKRTTAK